MTKYEFILRFSMLPQHKFKILNKIDPIYLNKIDDPTNLKHCLSYLDDIQKQIFWQKNNRAIESTLHWLEAENHYLISYDDDNYPALLKQISCAPLFILVKGNVELLSSPQLAMVGSRSFTEYGAQWARFFANELAINGLTITSGLALGIDAICHRGALDVSAKTMAVLGSGLAEISPKTNLNLAQTILENQGTIISEFLPYEKARAEYFPRRNRIISGLSLGTFVIEASIKSGSLITARYAIEQNRDVFALPGEIANQNAAGTNWLIQQGAYLVAKPTDILEHFSQHLFHKFKTNSACSNKKEKIIHPEVFNIINNKPIAVDIIALQTNQSIRNVMMKLLDLELAGSIQCVSGGYIRCLCIST